MNGTGEYVLIITPHEMQVDAPNVDSEVYMGSKEEIKELFQAALEDEEIVSNIIFAQVVVRAVPRNTIVVGEISG